MRKCLKIEYLFLYTSAWLLEIRLRGETLKQGEKSGLYIEGYRDESIRTLEKPTCADDKRLVQHLSGVSQSCLIDWIVFHKTNVSDRK